MSDYEPPTLYRERTITARKEHRCCECGRSIVNGESYQRVTGLWDCRFGSYATCSKCANTRVILAIELDEPCVWFGGLRERLADFEAEFGPLSGVNTVPSESM